MYPIPPHEHLVETRTCKHCQTPFPITDKDMEFYAKVSPKFGEKTYMIPPPTLCPDCRQQRRLSFRNERKLYKRKCDATGKDIISIYSPDKPYTVYHQDYWWSDAWEPMDYGRDFDFSRSAIEQFGKILSSTPKPQLINISSEDSEYCSFGGWNKNCYMIVGNNSQNCMYGAYTTQSSNCIDFTFSSFNEECYEIINCHHSHKLFFSRDCNECENSSFLLNCTGCRNCFGCVNLTNQEYQVFNKAASKEEFEGYMLYSLNKRDKVRESSQNTLGHLTLVSPRTCLVMKQCYNCIGDNVTNAKNTFYIYDSIGINGEIDSSKFVDLGTAMVDSYDITDAQNIQLSYENASCRNDYASICNILVIDSHNLYFSQDCYSSSHCFLCVGLRNKQYCIMNKQYTKEEYEVLVPRIIEHMMKTGEWGEFFPSSMSPFGYSETVAQEYYPMTREEILGNTPLGGGDARRAEGVVSEISEANPPVSPLTGGSSKDVFLHGPIFNYSDYEPPFPKVEKIIPANKLPDDISKIPDDILNWAIECEVTKKPFRIIPQELAFYRKHNIPIPRRHPDQRHLDRMAQRNPRKLYERLCDCPNCEENAKKSGSYREKEFDFRDPETRSGGQRRKMITTYAPERPETVYCEVCYEREVLS